MKANSVYMHSNRQVQLTCLLFVITFLPIIISGCQARPAATAIPTEDPIAAASGKDGLKIPTPAAEPSYWPTRGWRTSSPEAQGMDSNRLFDMLAFARERNINLHGLVIVRHGTIVTEAYFDPYTVDNPHEIASLTKSVIGTLVGIAVEEGTIDGVKTPLMGLFPGREMENLDDRKNSLTLEHFLTLTTGLDCSDMTGKEQQMMQSSNWTQFVLDLPMIAAPGEGWDYCSSAVHLLSGVLSEKTGMSAREYANQRLFAPLGIPAVPPEAWASDPQGVSTGGNGLHITPRDLAKYAFLYLQAGKWEDKQIVPAEWVQASLQPYATIGTDPNYGGAPRSYGYLWSVFPQDHFYAAFGMGSQLIYVYPEQDLIVIVTAAVPTNVLIQQMIDDFLLPAIVNDGALPESEIGMDRLAEAAAWFASPKQPVADLPEMAVAISGKTYILETNRLGWKSISLAFEPGSDTAAITFDDSLTASIGLDNLFRVADQPNLPGLGMKGRWTSTDTFSIRALLKGTFTEYDLKLKFRGDTVTLTMADIVWGGLTRVKGTARP